MDAIKGLYQEVGDWISYPFRAKIPVSHILIILGLFVVAAFIAYDSISILKTWMENAAETVADI